MAEEHLSIQDELRYLASLLDQDFEGNIKYVYRAITELAVKAWNSIQIIKLQKGGKE